MKVYDEAAISVDTGEIRVNSTLQVPGHPQIFAVGDVANTGGPKMARTSLFQTETVVSNITSLIQSKKPTSEYQPTDMEGSIVLTLGKVSRSGLCLYIVCGVVHEADANS